MIKSLQSRILFKKAFGIPLCNGIHIDNVLLARMRGRNIPHAYPKQPGVRVQRNLLEQKIEFPDETVEEHELEDDLDVMNLDKAYDEDARERKRFNERVKLKITAQKFFSPCPQPSMLTHNERLCIRYLHQQDPVQWDFKTLSESFPATPYIIKKVIKVKYKITPERAKIMDAKVQRNWELLAEGKLKADPNYLEHLKKFVNRREVLLEQIKNKTFYLPEIKKEHLWNQGEMSGILAEYEKSIEELAQENSPKTLSDGKGEIGDKKIQTSLDFTEKKIQAQHIPREKDSFIIRKKINDYKSHVTLEELENKVLEKAETKEKLELTEQAILENKLCITKEGKKKFNDSSTLTVTHQEAGQSLKSKQKVLMKFHKTDKSEEFEGDDRMRFQKTQSKQFSPTLNQYDTRMRFKKTEPGEFPVELNYDPPDENTRFGFETDIGKILNELQNGSKPKEKLSADVEDEKEKIDFSDPERIKRENIYYDKEVSHIKDTAFWKNNRSSKDKEIAEYEKRDLGGPSIDDGDLNHIPKIFVLNPNPYPERIKIPKSQQGSGLTFRIKDCYYDDDGEFLYRVPGMSK